LSYYPRPEEPAQNVDQPTQSTDVELVTTPAVAETVEDVDALPSQGESSYLGQIGKVIEPVMQPLGLDWKAGVALLSGASAKEIVVSTLGVLYSVDDRQAESHNLQERIVSSGDYSRASALAMIIFVLLYCPCLATLVAIAREAGGWKWAIFSVLYSTGLAWVLSFAAYRLALMFGL
jgi:ferrous iron transport protein B